MNNNLELWEKVFQENEWGKYPSIPVIRFIARNFYQAQNRETVKILEIGSGTGANLWFCAREGFSVYGVEGSPTAVNRMLDRFKTENLSGKIKGMLVGDYLEKLDEFENEYFDAVIDSESLCCNPFSYSHEVIKKCFAKLKKGGVMMSLTFAEGTWGMSGEEAGYHAVYPTEGPLSGKGLNRYVTRNDIFSLYKLKNNQIERIERQEYFFSDSEVIKEWIIEARKT